LERNKFHRELVNEVLSKFPNVKTVDQSESLCDEKSCPVVKDNILLYRDDAHLSLRGAVYSLRKFHEIFIKP
jgi:hypothetical protein